MEEYIDTVRKLVKSMEETSWLLCKFNNVKESTDENDFYSVINKLDVNELDELQDKYNRFEK